MGKAKLFVVAAVLLLLVCVIAVTSYVVLSQEKEKPFYVGVTYCGRSVQEAKELIDKVKDYTNLFILQSATLQNVIDVEEIGDYAIASNLKFAVYTSCSFYPRSYYSTTYGVNAAKERWGEDFIGVYFYDEPGGDMLDEPSISYGYVEQQVDGMPRSLQVSKHGDVISSYYYDNKTATYVYAKYYSDGRINITYYNTDYENYPFPFDYWYYPDGEITVCQETWGSEIENIVYTSENITQCPYPVQTYEQVLKQKPIQNNDDAAKVFVNKTKDRMYGNTGTSYLENMPDDMIVYTGESLNKTQLDKSVLLFTADYGLYWWDYKSDYDLVLAELAWNNSATQEIALVRGAANFQNKQWGTCITWKYTHAPFLTDGVEMFEQLKMSYEAGANYVMIFNYSEDPTNPNILLDEHFSALESFWNDIVQNPAFVHGSIRAKAILVLPENYGWGMRNQHDNIWGIWPADDASQEVWTKVQSKVNEYGLELDIVFEKPNFFASWKYADIYYWHQK